MAPALPAKGEVNSRTETDLVLDARLPQAQVASVLFGRFMPQAPTRPGVDDLPAERLKVLRFGQIPRLGVDRSDRFRPCLFLRNAGTSKQQVAIARTRA